MSRDAPNARTKSTARKRGKKGSPAETEGPGAQRINDAVRPVLTAVTQLRQLKRDRRPPPELTYQHVRNLLSRTFATIDSFKLPPEDVRDVRYALVAYIDEMMQLDPGPLKEFWQSHLLQLEHFGETRAGEGFFERIERVKSEGRTAVLRVYYLCLLFGFQGIYGQHGELERENLLEGVRSALHAGALSETPLSPNGDRPDEPGVDQERNRLIQWLAVCAACMAVLWYFGLLFTLDAQERSLSETLRDSFKDLNPGLEVSEE